MRLKKIELIVIALTLALTCFLCGYFTGRRSAVNIITVAPRNEMQSPVVGLPASAGNETGYTAPAPADNTDNTGAGAANAGSAGSEEQSAAPDGNGQGQASEIVGAPRGGDGRININTASRGELMDLSGIGEVLAGRIIDYRNQNGNFSRIEDIMKVTGIGERRFESIKDKITVG